MAFAKAKRTVRFRKSKSLRKVAAPVKTYVKKVMQHNLEKKYHDINITSSSFDDTGNIRDCLDANTQGTSDSQQRIGDEIRLRDIDMRLSFAVGDSTNIVRALLIRWNDFDAVNAPTMARILQVPTDPQSQLLWDNIKQGMFSVLMDRTIALDVVKQPLYVMHLKKYLKNSKVRFQGGGDNGTGKIFLIVIADSSAAPHPTYYQYTRITYTDA